MKIKKIYMVLFVLYFVFLSGCAYVNPMVKNYEKDFDDFGISRQYLNETKYIKEVFHYSYDEVWDNALYILAQHDIIIDLSKEQGEISYLTIEGVYFGDAFKKDQFFYWEFPFSVIMEKGRQSVTVYVYPMNNLYDEMDKKKKWWKIIDAGFDQEGRKFIERLSTQLAVKEKWEWLRN